MKRPTPEASTNSWVDIWLACMDTTFRRSNNASDSKANESRIETVAHKLPDRKIARSLHQGSCGHGYTPRDLARLHPGVQFFNGPPCELGCNPAEADGASRARAMKRLHG
jgi:hypothetical protein